MYTFVHEKSQIKAGDSKFQKLINDLASQVLQDSVKDIGKVQCMLGNIRVR